MLDGAERDPTDKVIPLVGQALAEALSERSAVLLRMVFEMSRADPYASEGVQRSMQHGLPDLIRYLSAQMANGRLRQMHPVFAVELLAGPIVTYQLTRPLAALVEYAPSREQLVADVVAAWLRAMTPAR